MVLGSIHGFQPGSWLVGGLVAILLSCGVPLLVAAKTVAVAVGAATTGLCAGVAGSLCKRREGALVASGVAGLAMAFCWPSIHHDLTGLTGTTPESVPFQLAALMLAFFRPWGPLRSSFFAGLALAIAWLLSFATIWTIALTLAALLRPKTPATIGIKDSVAALACALAAVLIVLTAIALVLPGGPAGVSTFLHWNWLQVVGTGAGISEGGVNRLLSTLLAAPTTLVAFSDAGPPLGRAVALTLGAALVALPALALWWTTRTHRLSTSAALALAGASWILPLSQTALDGQGPGSLARYFVVPMLLELIALAVVVGNLVDRAPLRGRLVATIVGLFVLLPVFVLPNWAMHLPASPDSARESLIFTGAHSIAAGQLLSTGDKAPPPEASQLGTERLLALLPFAPRKGRVPLLEGFGVDLGSDMGSADILGKKPWLVPRLLALRELLEVDEYAGLLVGAGCGLSVNTPLVIERAGLSSTTGSDAAYLSYGMGLCVRDAEERFDCSPWGGLDVLSESPVKLASFVAGLKASELPYKRLAEGPEQHREALMQLFVTPGAAVPPEGAPHPKPLLQYLPPRPDTGCREAPDIEVPAPRVCPEVLEQGSGTLIGTLTRSAPTQGDGLGTVTIAVFAEQPFSEELPCELSRATYPTVEVGLDTFHLDYLVRGIPTRSEPYFIAAVFDEVEGIDSAQPLEVEIGDLADLRGAALSWPQVSIQDSSPVVLDVDINVIYGK